MILTPRHTNMIPSNTLHTNTFRTSRISSPCNTIPPSYNVDIDDMDASCVKLFPTKSGPHPASEMMGHVQKKRRTSVKAKKVSFSDDVRVCYQDELSAEELKASWLQRDDMNRIRNENKICVLAYQKVGRKASRLPLKYCMRGLEKASSSSAALMVRSIRKDAIDSVLSVQKKSLIETGSCDEDTLRFVSEKKSSDQVKKAIKIAGKDSRIWVEEFRQFL